MENASTQFTMADINRRITHQTKKYQWEFLFLGANQDAIATAAHMGIQAHSSATFIANDDDIKAGSLAFADKVSAKRRMAAQCDLAVAEAASVDESMGESLEESRKKEPRT